MLSDANTEKTFCVYVHTNKINGKRYVGVTSQEPEKRWNEGKGYTPRQPHMYNAIQKWGWDNFEKEANTGKGIKVKSWMRGYITYVLPLIIILLFVFGLYNFFVK